MISRLLASAVIVTAGWWLWNGPLFEPHVVSYQEQLEINASDMKSCLGREESVDNPASVSTGTAEERCAKRLGLYSESGHWFRVDQGAGKADKLASNR